MRFCILAAFLCCALLARADVLRGTASSTDSAEARATRHSTLLRAEGSLASASAAKDTAADKGVTEDIANRVVEWLRGTVERSLSSLRSTVEEDVRSARTSAQDTVTSTKNTVLSSCRSAVDVAAGGVTSFNTQIDMMKDNFQREINAISSDLGVARTTLEEFARSLAAFFTPAFDVKGRPPACTLPRVLGEINTFFQSYFGAQPLSTAMWCRFMGIAARVRLDAAFNKMFDIRESLFRSTAFLEVDSETGEFAAVSEQVLASNIKWNIINVVYETLDGAVDITAMILAALDEGPVEEAAVEAQTGGFDPQLVVAIVASVLKLASASLKAAAVANGCNAA